MTQLPPDAAPDSAAPRAATIFAQPLTAADTAAYVALDQGAVHCPAALVWYRCDGPKAAEALNGLVTNDLLTLGVGHLTYAAALTAKGKVLTDLRVLREAPTRFLLGVPEAGAAAWFTMARKYINPRLCTVTDVSGNLQAWWVAGAQAESVRHACAAIGGDAVHAHPVPLSPTRPGALLIAEGDARVPVQAALLEASRAGSAALWEVLRVEAGWPAVGVDMTDETLAQEACLDTLGAISFAKGCYTGQETVARIHFRGHVNRLLRGVVATSPLPAGASVAGDDAAPVGDVRSPVMSPRLGPIALAMIRREVALGAMVTVVTPDGPRPARVVALPFGADGAG